MAIAAPGYNGPWL